MNVLTHDCQREGPKQLWSNTKEKTFELWELGQDKVKCHFEDAEKEKGNQDQINRTFVERF
jgi:hypothetical protein